MTAAAYVDPVLACGAILGALGFVGMAMVCAIQGQRHADEQSQWHLERAQMNVARYEREKELLERERSALDSATEGWTQAGALSDELALGRLHDAARCEGLIPAPDGPDSRWN